MTGKDFQYNARRIQLLIYCNFHPVQRNALGNTKFYHPALPGLDRGKKVSTVTKAHARGGVMHDNVISR